MELPLWRTLLVLSLITIGVIGMSLIMIHIVITKEPTLSLTPIPDMRRQEWFTPSPLKRSPSSSPLAATQSSYVIISDTETVLCFTKAACLYNSRHIRVLPVKAKELGDIVHNFFGNGNGNIDQGRNSVVNRARTLNYNNRKVGISFIDSVSDNKLSLRQLDAVQKLLDYVVRYGKIANKYKVFAHKKFIKSDSPHDKLYNIMTRSGYWSVMS